MKIEWFKFDYEQWLTDSKHRALSINARGLWIQILCMLWESERVGYLMKDGVSIQVEDLAKATNSTEIEVERCIFELEAHRFLSETEDGTFYSPEVLAAYAAGEYKSDTHEYTDNFQSRN